MKTILVPTDFSPNATKALDYAAQLAKMADANIVIMHVTDLTHASMNENVILPEAFDKEIIHAANEKLDMMAAATREISGQKVEKQLYNGFVTDAIEKAAKENNADLVVMGTLGNAAIKEKLFGSITAKLISHLPIPILAIPLLYEWETPKNILLAVNHFDEEPSTLLPVIELSRLLNATLNVTIFTDEDTAGAVDYLQHRKDIDLFCRNMQHDCPELEILPTPVYGRNFEDAITTYISENPTEMLVMITHKRNFLESIFSRSMTRKMSYHTDIPLLSIPAY